MNNRNTKYGITWNNVFFFYKKKNTEYGVALVV